jgi:hypothetical protein
MLASREKRACSTYLTDEQRRQRANDQASCVRNASGEALGFTGFADKAGAQAPGADPNVLAGAAYCDVHALQVGTLQAFGLDVRVANVVGHDSLFSANCTLRRHGFSRGA